MDNLAHKNAIEVEASLGREDGYDISVMTPEAIDELFEQENLQTDIEDLWTALGEYIKVNDRVDADPDELTAKRLEMQQQLANVAADMGLLKWTPELYQQLYGKAA
jgi:gamma-glutamyl:cysteine ligase YbdK (ATP-grasp superfamily)